MVATVIQIPQYGEVFLAPSKSLLFLLLKGSNMIGRPVSVLLQIASSLDRRPIRINCGTDLQLTLSSVNGVLVNECFFGFFLYFHSYFAPFVYHADVHRIFLNVCLFFVSLRSLYQRRQQWNKRASMKNGNYQSRLFRTSPTMMEDFCLSTS